MANDRSSVGVSRRAVLAASGATVGFSSLGTVKADEDHGDGQPECPEGLFDARTAACADAARAGCSDDHPETNAIREAVRNSLDANYSTVGALIEAGYVPYFDTVMAGRSGVSHWLNPEYLGDGHVLDPERPESVLVSNEYWRSLGVMFIATEDGDGIDAPPAVYETDGERCAPWHAHTEVPARFAWWYYERAYQGERSSSLPCPTPCMLHVWVYPNPAGVYSHEAPPPGNRGGPPAEPAGFETDAEPGADTLGWDVLPDDLVARAKPDVDVDVDVEVDAEVDGDVLNRSAEYVEELFDR